MFAACVLLNGKSVIGVSQAHVSAVDLDRETQAFLQSFAQEYATSVLRSRRASSKEPLSKTYRVLRELVRSSAGVGTVSEAQDNLVAIRKQWGLLSIQERIFASATMHDALMQDLFTGVRNGKWIDEAVLYTKTILKTTDGQWALRLWQNDTAGRRIFVAGREYNGDSLRYAGDLTTGSYRDRGKLYQLLGFALIARRDTVAAANAWRHAWDEEGRGDALPEQYETSRRLLDLTRGHGDFVLAAKYAGDAFLLAPRDDGRISADLRTLTTQLDTLYRETHSDTSPIGLQGYLDSLYGNDFPRHGGIPAVDYTGPRNGRTVLLSTMTWVDCGGCRIRDDVLDAMLDRYASRDVFVLVHHYEVPFVTPGASSVEGAWTVEHGLIPTAYDRRTRDDPCGIVHINGTCPPIGNAGTLRLYDLLVRQVDMLLAQRALGTMTVSVRWREGSIVVDARVDTVVSWPHHLKVQIGLVEDSVHFQGGNHLRIWRMIPRKFAGDSANYFGFDLAIHRTIVTTFDLAQVERAIRDKNDWIDSADGRPPRSPDETALRTDSYRVDRSHLYVMAFIQDALTGEVLHTVVEKVPAP